METETNIRKKRRYTREERERILSAYRSSSQTQKGFCREVGLPLATLGQWLSRSRQPDDTGKLIEVSLPTALTNAAAASLAIELPGGIVVRIAAGTSASWVREIIHVLRCGA